MRRDPRTITLVLPVPGGPWMREKGGITCWFVLRAFCTHSVSASNCEVFKVDFSPSRRMLLPKHACFDRKFCTCCDFCTEHGLSRKRRLCCGMIRCIHKTVIRLTGLILRNDIKASKQRLWLEIRHVGVIHTGLVSSGEIETRTPQASLCTQGLIALTSKRFALSSEYVMTAPKHDDLYSFTSCWPWMIRLTFRYTTVPSRRHKVGSLKERISRYVYPFACHLRSTVTWWLPLLPMISMLLMACAQNRTLTYLSRLRKQA